MEDENWLAVNKTFKIGDMVSIDAGGVCPGYESMARTLGAEINKKWIKNRSVLNWKTTKSAPAKLLAIHNQYCLIELPPDNQYVMSILYITKISSPFLSDDLFEI